MPRFSPLRVTGALCILIGLSLLTLSWIGLYSVIRATRAQANVIPPFTATPAPTATLKPTATATRIPTAAPTSTALPTATPPPTRTPRPVPSGPLVVIRWVNKGKEYVDLANEGNQAQDLSGWALLSQRGAQSCELQGEIAPGEILRVWAMAEDRDEEGFCCDFESPIWNNDEIDLAILLDEQGQEVDRK